LQVFLSVFFNKNSFTQVGKRQAVAISFIKRKKISEISSFTSCNNPLFGAVPLEEMDTCYTLVVI